VASYTNLEQETMFLAHLMHLNQGLPFRPQGISDRELQMELNDLLEEARVDVESVHGMTSRLKKRSVHWMFQF